MLTVMEFVSFTNFFNKIARCGISNTKAIYVISVMIYCQLDTYAFYTTHCFDKIRFPLRLVKNNITSF